MRIALARAGLAATLALGVFAAAPVAAGHGAVQSSITIVHNGVDQMSYTNTQPCVGASCQVFVSVPSKRDAGRFKRWCGPFALTRIDIGLSSATAICQGPSTWSIEVDWFLVVWNGSAYVLTTHGEDVWVSTLLSP